MVHRKGQPLSCAECNSVFCVAWLEASLTVGEDSEVADKVSTQLFEARLEL